jgi:response regulator of citrate/malate metabolism
MFRASLSWVKSAKAFLKVQAGTGDNLLEEDIREGFIDYLLKPLQPQHPPAAN